MTDDVKKDLKDKNVAVYAIYKSRVEAENAVSRLKFDGFRSSDVSVLFSDNESSKEFAHEKGTKAPEGGAVGAGAGAIIGGALGWLAGIGLLAIPAVGPFIAAGPIVGLLAGAGTAGVIGGVAGGLIGLGMPEYEAKRYEGIITTGGGILLSVHCDNDEWVEKAKHVLEATGGSDVAAASEAKADVKVDRHNRPELRAAT